jgi:hypothetical protein
VGDFEKNFLQGYSEQKKYLHKQNGGGEISCPSICKTAWLQGSI